METTALEKHTPGARRAATALVGLLALTVALAVPRHGWAQG